MWRKDLLDYVPLYAEFLNCFIPLLSSMINGKRINRVDVRLACGRVYRCKVTEAKREKLRSFFMSRHKQVILDIMRLTELKAQGKIHLRTDLRREVEEVNVERVGGGGGGEEIDGGLEEVGVEEMVGGEEEVGGFSLCTSWLPSTSSHSPPPLPPTPFSSSTCSASPDRR